MKITIEESPKSIWEFDTDAIPSRRLREHIINSVNTMLAPIRTHMHTHGKILSIEVK